MDTPHPPATAEFGVVAPGGPSHAYPVVGSLSVVKLSVGPFDNNVYIVSSDSEALIVDGANDAERILAQVEGLEVVAIIQTHGHFDHVQALGALVDALGCPVRAHPADAATIPVPIEPLADGDVLRVADTEVRVLHIPGHTPGSTCFVAEEFLFSGDTLFPGGPGNTEGDDRRFDQIMRGLEERIFSLPDGTRVCPGHGLDTFIGREREHLPVWRSRGW